MIKTILWWQANTCCIYVHQYLILLVFMSCSYEVNMVNIFFKQKATKYQTRLSQDIALDYMQHCQGHHILMLNKHCK